MFLKKDSRIEEVLRSSHRDIHQFASIAEFFQPAPDLRLAIPLIFVFPDVGGDGRELVLVCGFGRLGDHMLAVAFEEDQERRDGKNGEQEREG